MAYQQQKFHVDGSNALKSEEIEYDVFVKPRFLSDRDAAPIIDLTNVYDRSHKPIAGQTCNTDHTRFRSRAMNALKHNRLLGDLFITRKRNSYRHEDLIVFAKGFSVTGVAMFFMILFGA